MRNGTRKADVFDLFIKICHNNKGLTMKIDVKTYARRFELLCMGLIPLVLAAPALLWFFGDKILDSTYGIELATFSLEKRLGMFLLECISSAFVAYGLWLCIKIARCFKRGEVFTPVTADLFARVSKVAACWGLYNMLKLLGIYLVLTSHETNQFSMLLLGVAGLVYLFIFIFLAIFATLVAKASELQKDQDLTV